MFSPQAWREILAASRPTDPDTEQIRQRDNMNLLNTARVSLLTLTERSQVRELRRGIDDENEPMIPFVRELNGRVGWSCLALYKLLPQQDRVLDDIYSNSNTAGDLWSVCPVAQDWTIQTKDRTQKRFKITLFIRTKHNMRIFGVISFFKLQNNI